MQVWCLSIHTLYIFIGRHIDQFQLRMRMGYYLLYSLKTIMMTTVSMENYDQIQIMNYTDKEFFLLLCRTYTTIKMKRVTPLWQLCMWIERQSFIHWKPPDGSSITRFIKSLTNDAVINSISMTENQRWNLSLLLCYCCWCDIRVKF